MYTFSLDSAFPSSISGAKAFHLSKMKSAGYPIPAGFVITTKAFDDFYKNKCSLTAEMKEELMFALKEIILARCVLFFKYFQFFQNLFLE